MYCVETEGRADPARYSARSVPVTRAVPTRASSGCPHRPQQGENIHRIVKQLGARPWCSGPGLVLWVRRPPRLSLAHLNIFLGSSPARPPAAAACAAQYCAGLTAVLPNHNPSPPALQLTLCGLKESARVGPKIYSIHDRCTYNLT